MRTRILSRLLFAVPVMLLALASCKKERGANNEPPPVKPVAREKGVADGDATQQNIGAQGGTISTPDGRLTIIIPAGAVNTNTSFSIQPITNSLPLSPGAAYRLLPSHMAFQKPVTVQFTYHARELEGTSAGALYLAFQDVQNVWQVKAYSRLEEDKKTVSVETMHFSDWALFEQFQLQPGEAVLSRKGQTQMKVMTNQLQIKDSAGVVADTLAVGGLVTVEKAGDVTNWQITGEGTITSSGSGATVTAPDKSGAMEITVHIPAPPKIIDLDKKRDKYKQDMRLKYIVFSVMNKDQYVTSQSDEGNAVFDNVIIASNTASITITVLNSQVSTKMVLAVRTASPGVNTTYRYDNQKALGNYYVGRELYTQSYFTCGSPSKEVFSGGGIKITQWGKIGTYAEGQYEGVFYDGNCPNAVKTQSISGRFKGMRYS